MVQREELFLWTAALGLAEAVLWRELSVYMWGERFTHSMLAFPPLKQLFCQTRVMNMQQFMGIASLALRTRANVERGQADRPSLHLNNGSTSAVVRAPVAEWWKPARKSGTHFWYKHRLLYAHFPMKAGVGVGMCVKYKCKAPKQLQEIQKEDWYPNPSHAIVEKEQNTMVWFGEPAAPFFHFFDLPVLGHLDWAEFPPLLHVQEV